MTTTISAQARAFLEACETGAGWDGCKAYCHEYATFSAQSEPLLGIETLADYAEWMKELFRALPDGSYTVKSFAVDVERGHVCAHAVFSGTHTGDGGPVVPTGRRTASDYVYVMEFEDGRIRHLTKIWNAPFAMRQLGWE